MPQENPRGQQDEDALASRPMDQSQTGESGGGPYPNQRDENYPDAHDFKGGQSDHAYYGKDPDDERGNSDNAPSEEH